MERLEFNSHFVFPILSLIHMDVINLFDMQVVGMHTKEKQEEELSTF